MYDRYVLRLVPFTNFGNALSRISYNTNMQRLKKKDRLN